MPTKRFYCTICKKVKRVRVLPALVDTPMSPNPANRTGECDRHSRVFTPANIKQSDARIRVSAAEVNNSMAKTKHKMNKGAK